MPANPTIVDLRNRLATRFLQEPPPSPAALRTGIASLDLAAGGLRQSAITELISPRPSAGSALLVHALLVTAQRDQFFVALVDGADSFDPQSADADLLPHLLWLRCSEAPEALKATDFLLRDGNFPLVILDLVLNPNAQLRRIPASHWYRLQRLVERVPTALLVMSRHNLVASAQCKLVLEQQWSLSDLGCDDLLARLRLHVRRAAISSAANS